MNSGSFRGGDDGRPFAAEAVGGVGVGVGVRVRSAGWMSIGCSSADGCGVDSRGRKAGWMIVGSCDDGAFTRRAGCSVSSGVGVCGRSVGCVVSSRSVDSWEVETLAEEFIKFVSDLLLGIVGRILGDVELEREVEPGRGGSGRSIGAGRGIRAMLFLILNHSGTEEEGSVAVSKVNTLGTPSFELMRSGIAEGVNFSNSLRNTSGSISEMSSDDACTVIS